MFKKKLTDQGLPLASASAVALFAGVMALSATPAAQAGFSIGFTQSSRVDTDINPNAGKFEFDYTLFNTSVPEYGGAADDVPFIVDWEMPWNPASSFQPVAGVNAFSPEGWEFDTFEIGKADADAGWGGIADWQTPGDEFNDFLLEAIAGGNTALPIATAQAMLDATHVMRWYIEPDFSFADACDGVNDLITVTSNGSGDCSWGWFGEAPPNAVTPYGGGLDGFKLIADDAVQVPSPYQASWAFLPIVTGDPPAPGEPGNGPTLSPSFITPATTSPEPASLALVATGLLGGAAIGLRRRRRKDKV